MPFTINYTLLFQILLICFYTIAGIQILYYLIFFSRLVFYKNKKNQSNQILPVSIIICAKNELENLQKNLISILEQKYHPFEVIVVNDYSVDDSIDFLNSLKPKYPHLKVIDIIQESITFSGKRLALSLGLKGASHDWCLLTDADCSPSGPNWLLTMQQNFTPNKSVVLGYAPYLKSNGFLNKCIRFETFITAFQYLNFAISGLPYMGVGRNMAYTKKIYFDNKGYKAEPGLISGDDDLFINKIANSKNTCIEISSATFMYSQPKDTWYNWFLQKRRHITAGKKYKLKHKILLSLNNVSHLLFYVLFIVLILNKIEWQIVLLLFGIRLVIQAIDYGVAMKKLKEADLFWYYPLFDVLLPIYHLLLVPALILKPKNKWK